MNKKHKPGDLRVWWVPQIPMTPFHVYVKNIHEAVFILETLAEYDLFQLRHNIKPNFSSDGGLEVYVEWEGAYDWDEWIDEYEEYICTYLDGNFDDKIKLLLEKGDAAGVKLPAIKKYMGLKRCTLDEAVAHISDIDKTIPRYIDSKCGALLEDCAECDHTLGIPCCHPRRLDMCAGEQECTRCVHRRCYPPLFQVGEMVITSASSDIPCFEKDSIHGSSMYCKDCDIADNGTPCCYPLRITHVCKTPGYCSECKHRKCAIKKAEE
jgi:hypothetical protein